MRAKRFLAGFLLVGLVLLLVPVTFFMEPVPAIASIVTATAMAIFAGDIPSCRDAREGHGLAW